VADLLVDSRGRVWAATLGSGIGVWDGQSWSALRTSNSDLPYNTVQVVTEIDAGIFWIGSSNPADLGGLVSRLEGEEWKTFKPILSGYTGGETLAIAQDSEGRLWFGTRTKGINIYAPRK
jgi:ligand-binding sensor domain-containing protein